MKIILKSDRFDKLLFEEMSYSLASENYSIERPIVPRKQYSHHFL